MKKMKKISTTSWLLFSLLLFSACTNNDTKDIMEDKSTNTEALSETKDTSEMASPQGIENLEPVLTLEQALALFYSTFEKEKISVKSIRFEKGDGENYRYFIDGWDENYQYKLEADVGTAEIIEQEKEIASTATDKLDLDAAIPPKEAMEVALTELDDESVESWELKVDQNNRMIYKIDFLSGRIQKVDGLAGKVL